MNILQLTPGTGNFYCENCLHDSALVTGLQKIGCSATLVPMYLPVLEDRPSGNSKASVQFGGVNTYLQQSSALFRHTPAWIDSLFNTGPVLKFAASRPATTKAALVGEILVSMLRGIKGYQVKEINKLIEYLRSYHQPDVIILSNIMLLGLAQPLKEALGVPVVCSLQGEDVYIDHVPEPYRTEAWMLVKEQSVHASCFIGVSHYYSEEMTKRLNLPKDLVSTVHSGVNTSMFVPKTKDGTTPKTVMFLSRIIEEKGIEELIKSVGACRHTPSLQQTRLLIAGSATSADKPFIDKLYALADSFNFGPDFDVKTNITLQEKIHYLQNADIVSVPCRYPDAFGLFIIEALACGTPVVQPSLGGFTEVIEDTGGGICYAPSDPDGLSTALKHVLQDDVLREKLALSGRKKVESDYTDIGMAHKILEILRTI
jgi:glycosyltransferase involved in cell wall biosynthesis